MNELQRLTYLEAMGIDNYYPRHQLPAARPSERCEIPVLPSVADKTSATQAASSSVDIKGLLDEPAKPQHDIRPEHAPADLAAVPRFALSIVRAESGLLIVDDGLTPDSDQSAYLQLLHNMVFALGFGKQSLALEPFVWPMVDNVSLDQSEAAAQQALTTFLSRRAQNYIVLMGDQAARYAGKQQWPVAELVNYDAAVQLICTASALAALKQPQLKRQIWQDLHSLYTINRND